MRISRSDCRTNTLMKRRGYTIIFSVTMNLIRDVSSIKIQLGCLVEIIYIHLVIKYWILSIHLV